MKTKKCNECQKDKPTGQFPQVGLKRGKTCQRCINLQNAQKADKRTQKPRINNNEAFTPNTNEITRECHECGEIKPLDEKHFQPHKYKTRQGPKVSFERRCIECRKAGQREKGREAYQNPEKRLYQIFKAHEYRAEQLGVVGEITLEEFRKVLESKDCHWCGFELSDGNRHVDHVVPLGLGGRHHVSNVVACCKFCNRAKFTEDADEFVAWMAWLKGTSRGVQILQMTESLRAQ